MKAVKVLSRAVNPYWIGLLLVNFWLISLSVPTPTKAGKVANIILSITAGRILFISFSESLTTKALMTLQNAAAVLNIFVIVLIFPFY